MTYEIFFKFRWKKPSSCYLERQRQKVTARPALSGLPDPVSGRPAWTQLGRPAEPCGLRAAHSDPGEAARRGASSRPRWGGSGGNHLRCPHQASVRAGQPGPEIASVPVTKAGPLLLSESPLVPLGIRFSVQSPAPPPLPPAPAQVPRPLRTQRRSRGAVCSQPAI